MTVNPYYPVRKLLPIENIVLGNRKHNLFGSVTLTTGLLSIMRREIMEQDGNTMYVLCSYIPEREFLHDWLDARAMPKHVFVVHPDLVFEVVQNVIANPDITGDPTKPRKIVKLYIDLLDHTSLCINQHDLVHNLQFSHRLVNEAAHYVNTISASVAMNLQ